MKKAKISFVAAAISGFLLWLVSYFFGTYEAWDNLVYYAIFIFSVSLILAYHNEGRIFLWPTAIWTGQSMYTVILFILDSGSANLWPLSLIFGYIIIFPISISGGFLGMIIRKLLSKMSASKNNS